MSKHFFIFSKKLLELRIIEFHFTCPYNAVRIGSMADETELVSHKLSLQDWAALMMTYLASHSICQP